VSEGSEGISGELRTKGGVLRATITPGEAKNQIRTVRFDGAIKPESESDVRRLEAALSGATVDQAPGKIEDFFAQNPGAIGEVEPEDFLTVLTLAFMKVRRASSSAPDPHSWKKGKT
jgi:hypothetical protein